MIIAISGIGSGIGKALFSHIVDNTDHCVVGFNRVSMDCKETATSMQLVADVKHTNAWEWVFNQTFNKWGNFPDILVNNAGVNRLDWMQDFSVGAINNIIDTNVKGYLYGIKELAALPPVASNPRVLINIGSVAGRIPMRGSLPYCASKAAVDMMTKTAARELAPHTLVFGVNPGRLNDTQMGASVDDDVLRVRGWSKEEAAKYQMTYLPMKRYGDLTEVVKVITFCMFNAPVYMSGSILEVAGAQ